MHPVAQTIEEIGDDERLMLCSEQQNKEMLEEISTQALGSHVFEIDYWCVIASIDEDIHRENSVITK